MYQMSTSLVQTRSQAVDGLANCTASHHSNVIC